MPKFIRFKQEDMRVLEVDVNSIKVLQIELCEDGEYVLTAYSSTQAYGLCFGNFDETHTMLNKIHDILNIEIIDL